jgi:hypothetical protein
MVPEAMQERHPAQTSHRVIQKSSLTAYCQPANVTSYRLWPSVLEAARWPSEALPAQQPSRVRKEPLISEGGEQARRGAGQRFMREHYGAIFRNLLPLTRQAERAADPTQRG